MENHRIKELTNLAKVYTSNKDIDFITKFVLSEFPKKIFNVYFEIFKQNTIRDIKYNVKNKDVISKLDEKAEEIDDLLDEISNLKIKKFEDNDIKKILNFEGKKI